MTVQSQTSSLSALASSTGEGSPRLHRVRFENYEEAAKQSKRRLPKALYDNIIVAQAGRGVTFRDNVESFDRVRFRPRAGVAFASHDLSTEVLGHKIDFPVLLAPVGNLRMVHPSGARGAARAAGRAGTIAVTSMSAGHSASEIADVASGPLWQQLYLSHGQEAAKRVIHEARSAGFTALMVTVDCPTRPRKKVGIDVSLQSALEHGPSLAARPVWTARFLRDGARLEAARAALGPESGEPIRWADLEWIKELWGGPLIVKGIVTPEDVEEAIRAGADAIVVSNHGGLVLDGAPASLVALPMVLKAVNGRCDVYLDSGVRQGSDVVKAVAMGAKAVLVGRAYVAGLAVAGEHGASKMLDLFKEDIRRTLAMLGCPSIASLTQDFVSTHNLDGRGKA